MKTIILFSMIISSLSFNNSKNSFLNDWEEKLIKYIKNNNEEIHIYSYNEIQFFDESGYFFQFKDNDEIKESILIKGTLDNFNIEAICNANEIPFNEGNYFCVNPFKFINENEAINCNSLVDQYHYDDFNVSYESIKIDSSKYIRINNYANNIEVITGNGFKEINVKNVPNYYNTQFNGNGCVPTSFAMYLAYLEDNGYQDIALNYDLPINHLNDKNKVDRFIKYLGDNYFYTNNMTGTNYKNIVDGINNYLISNNMGQYYCEIGKNYFDVTNAIENATTPIIMNYPIFKNNKFSNNHAVLIFGYREVDELSYIDRYLHVNAVESTSITSAYLPITRIRQFYFIHR